MEPLWVIEANVNGLPSEALQAEIRRQGMECRVIKHFPGAKRPGDILNAETVSMDAHVIFVGTLTLMRYIQTERRWRPGGWCSFHNLACSAYYAHFGDFLLNRNYSLMPCADAARQADRLFRQFGRAGQVFVRPDSVDKSFPGKLVDTDDFAELIRSISFDPTTLVLIAEPQHIGREWRLVICGDKVVAASQYLNHGTSDVAAGCPAEVLDFVSRTLHKVEWRPDPLFVVDVGESDHGLLVLELNSFSCSGWYQCDQSAIVSAARDCAVHSC